jgi:hypothetical protein
MPQNFWWHFAEVIFLLIILGAITFKIIQPTSKDVFSPGAQQATYETKHYALIDLPMGGCSYLRPAITEMKK